MQEPEVSNCIALRTIIKELSKHNRDTVGFSLSNMAINASIAYAAYLISLGGDDAVSALAIIGTIKSISDASTMLFFGTGTAAAHSLGSQREDRIKQVLVESIKIGVGVSVPILSLFYNSGRIVRAITANEAQANIVQQHFNQYGWGVPLIYSLAALSQASLPFSSNPTTATILFSNSLTGLSSYLFTNGMGNLAPMPYSGTGLGSSLSILVSNFLLGAYFRAHPQYENVWSGDLQFDRAKIRKEILGVGGPSAINMACQISSGAIATALVAKYLSSTELQQLGLALIPIGFLQTMLSCNSDMGAVKIAEKYGASELEDIRSRWLASVTWGVMAGTLGTTILGLSSNATTRLFGSSIELTPQYLDTVRRLIILGGASQIVSSLGSSSVGALKGIGETWKPLLANVAIKVGLNLALSYTLIRNTRAGIYSPYLADMIISLGIYSPALFTYAAKQFRISELQARKDKEIIEAPADDCRDVEQEPSRYGCRPLTFLYNKFCRPQSSESDLSAGLLQTPSSTTRKKCWPI